MNEKLFSAEIIAVGDEVLSGRVVDTNSAFLAREIAQLGLAVKHCQTVADDAADILAALRTAVGRSNVIVFCGGLGPTEDDLTKETICRALGMPFEVNEQALADMESFFRSRGAEMTENNRKQALVPRGCTVLRNENGTAPGIFIMRGTQAIVLLPGPPHELEPMFKNHAAPLLLTHFSKQATACKTLRVTGIGESALETKVKELLYGENPHTALYAKMGEVEVVITAYAADEQAAELLCEQKAAQLRELLGEYIYSENGASLAETVVSELSKSGRTVALAESCTGGMVAGMLTDVAGASAVFEYGIASYADWVKIGALDVDRSLVNKHTAISSVVAAEMARGAMRHGRADYGVGITGVAGPGRGPYLDKPVGLVYIAVCDKKRTVVRKYNFGDKRSRADVRRWASIAALELLRRFHMELPLEGDCATYGSRQIADMTRKGRQRTKAGLAARKTVSALLAICVTAAACFFGVQGARAAENRSSYRRLAREFSYEAAQSDAFAALTAQNSDTAGWLRNETGSIDTVVVTERNDLFYSGHDFYKDVNSLGCAALQQDTLLAQRPQNLVVTASCAGEDVQFYALPNYLDAAYAQQNALFSFSCLQFNGQYRVVSAFLVDSAEGIDDILFAPSFQSDEQLEQFVVNIKMRSVLGSELDINSSDRFLTLVCDYPEGGWDGCRMVVVARQLRSGETLTDAQTAFSGNTAALYPAAWYESKGIVCNINVSAEADKWREWLRGYDAAQENDGEAQNSYTIKVMMNGEFLQSSPLDVVSRMVAYLVDEDSSPETVKAVAVTCATELKRSYDSGQQLPEVSGRTPSDDMVTAVEQVINEVLTYNGELCWAPVFYCSSGDTNDASWMHLEESYPHLQSVVSPYDYLIWSTGYHRVTSFSSDTLRARLESYYDITLSGNTANWIQITERTPVGYVTGVTVDGQVAVDAYQFFTDVLALPSAHATVSTWGNTVSITTYGTGYGVGMSIAGAQQYVKSLGWGYERILTHYYTGVSITEQGWESYISAE
ncbi:MAG: competence/damage-inducible protein A [Oscillospiraceae bacterium]|nr:competence/damage-inducible protein A [Oscillospiraceae bacterium]